MARRDTLVHQLADWAENTPDNPAIHGQVDGAWRSYTWKEYWTAVRETAKGLIALGHQTGECVAIVGVNRTDWVICQFGIMAAGGVFYVAILLGAPVTAMRLFRGQLLCFSLLTEVCSRARKN